MKTVPDNSIKVVCTDMMCYYVDKATLKALCCSFYDPWALSQPNHDPTITQHDLWEMEGRTHNYSMKY